MDEKADGEGVGDVGSEVKSGVKLLMLWMMIDGGPPDTGVFVSFFTEE
jgi:hypothetical protein